jgi:hypothetical protein
LNTVTVSDEPQDLASQVAELDQQIAAARAQGLNAQKLVSERIKLSTRAALAAGPRG